jgi:hypothetical protein
MIPINNKDDWWTNVNEHWADLKNIIRMFNNISSVGLAALEELRFSKDPELGWYFQKAWENAPDSPEIHNIPSWHVLCDLCSERWVFEEE